MKIGNGKCRKNTEIEFACIIVSVLSFSVCTLFDPSMNEKPRTENGTIWRFAKSVMWKRQIAEYQSGKIDFPCHLRPTKWRILANNPESNAVNVCQLYQFSSCKHTLFVVISISHSTFTIRYHSRWCCIALWNIRRAFIDFNDERYWNAF